MEAECSELMTIKGSKGARAGSCWISGQEGHGRKKEEETVARCGGVE